MSERDKALIQAIKFFNRNQSRLADALGISRQKVNSWLNKSYRIPVEDALTIEILTESAIRAEALCPHAKKKILRFKRYWGKTLN